MQQKEKIEETTINKFRTYIINYSLVGVGLSKKLFNYFLSLSDFNPIILINKI